MMREKSSYSILRSLVKGQHHNFFKEFMGVFCTVGGTLVTVSSEGPPHLVASYDTEGDAEIVVVGMSS
jgi:hypothetical protein